MILIKTNIPWHLRWSHPPIVLNRACNFPSPSKGKLDYVPLQWGRTSNGQRYRSDGHFAASRLLVFINHLSRTLSEILTTMSSYAYWTANKTNHMNAPAYVSVLGTLCVSHIYGQTDAVVNISFFFFPGEVLMSISCSDMFEKQNYVPHFYPQSPVTTRK